MIGSLIGNYKVERELGEGGMSHVYVGVTQEETSFLPKRYSVVLKIMSDELAGETTARKRFVKEAEILSRLRHRYITRFYEFIPRDQGAVLVMEFVDGAPLDRILSQKGALPIPEAIAIVQCLLEALVYAHGKGIIHRDIKPANLIVQKNGQVKVTDFGIAKMKEAGGPGVGQTVLTKSGFLLGTPHYMSPEQIREPKDAGARSDVYSSAIVLYEMLTGVLPFSSRSLPKLIDAVYRGDKPSPRSLRPDIDQDLETIVLRAMRPNMNERYGTAREFFEALEEYAARPRLETPAPAPVDSAPTEPPTPLPKMETEWHLVPHQKTSDVEAHPIRGESIMLGRDRTCTIVLSHPAVSRRHARITRTGADYYLEDLKSANGTYVNDTRIDKARIKPGDVVRFGADPTCSYIIREQ